MSTLSGSNISQTYQGLLKMTDSTSGVTGTLQTVQSGDGTNTPLQISQTQVNISGSLTINGNPVTNVNTGSFVTTSSFNAYTSSVDTKLDGLDIETGSLQNQINGLATTGSLSGYTTVTTFNNYTSSNDSKVNSLISKTGSYATTGSNQFNGNQSISGSVQASSTVTSLDGFVGGYFGSNINNTIYGNTLVDIKTSTTSNNGKVRLYSNGNYPFRVEVSGSLNVRDGITGSLQGTASYATQALSASYAPDNSNRNGLINTGSIGGSQSITGSLNVGGTLTATSASITYLETVYETASVIYSSGSNQLGDASDDVQTLWGTVNLPTGPLTITGSLHSSNIIGTGSLFLQPNQADSRLVEIYNTSPTDTHITASGGQIFLGDDQTYVKVDNYGSVERIDIVAGNELNVSSSVVNVTGSLNAPSITGSLEGTASYATNANSASFAPTIIPNWVATTGSNTFVGNQTILGDLEINSPNPVGTFVNIVSTGTTSFLMNSPLTQFQSNGEMLFKNTISSTGSADINFRTENGGDITFNTSNSGSVAITGSVNISGSVRVIGNQINTGSLDVRSGSLDLFSNGTTVNTDLYLTNSLGGQSNIIKGWGDNQLTAGPGSNQANYTGSLRITGSNNILSMPQIRATGFGSGGADMTGYISGSDNTIQGNFAGIFLNTGSLLFPKTTNNYLGFNSSLLMNFTTSSLAGGHPLIQNNTLYAGQIVLNSNSGSINATGNILNGGVVTSTQNFVTSIRPAISTNIIDGSQVQLNHISSSIQYGTNISNANLVINNAVSSSITNNLLAVNNNTFLGGIGGGATNHSIFVSGSQNSNAARTINNNLIGGSGNVISSSFVSSSNSNLNSSIIYGNSLAVSASHTSGQFGGTAFFGRFNDTGSLADAQNIVFAVGTGTGTSNRRTSLWIDQGSITNVSGALNLTGSLNVSGSNVTTKLNGPTSINGVTNVLTVTGSATIQHSIAGQNALTIINGTGLSQPGLEVQGATTLLGTTLMSGSAIPLRIIGQSMTNVGLQVTGETTLIGNTSISGSNPLRVGVNNNTAVIQTLGGSQFLYRDGDNNTVVGNAGGVGTGFFAGSEKNMIFNGFATPFATGSNNVLIQGGGDNFISGSNNVFIGNHNGHAGGSDNILIGGTSYSSGSIFNSKFEISNVTTPRIFHKQGADPLQIGDDTQITGSLRVSSLTDATGSYFVTTDSTGLLTRATTQQAILSAFSAGAFYSTGSVTTTANTSGSFVYDTTVDSQGITRSGSQITVSRTGLYNIQFSTQIDNGSGAADVAIWLKKNGTNVADTATVLTVPSNHKDVLALNLWDNANAGDYYELTYQSDSSNTSFATIAASGNIPRSPGIIVTVNQIR
jgi:hypothetical protein